MRCPRCGWRINTLTKEKLEEMKKTHPNAWRPWKPEDDVKLVEMAKAGKNVGECAAALGRQPAAIQKRLILLTNKVEDMAYLTPAELMPTPAPEVTYLDRGHPEKDKQVGRSS